MSSSSGDRRPAIPPDVKLRVRQRDGFGCVRCGCPIVDYEHLIDYAEVKEHSVDNIYLACPVLHASKSGLIPVEKIQEHIRNPANRQGRQTTSTPLFFAHRRFTLELGGCEVSNAADQPATAVEIDGHRLLHFEVGPDGVLQFSADLRARDGHQLLLVENNEATVLTSLWDLTWTRASSRDKNGSLLTLRYAPRQIALTVRFFPELARVSIERANIFHGDRVVAIKGRTVKVNSLTISEQSSRNVDVLLSVGERPTSKSCSILVR